MAPFLGLIETMAEAGSPDWLSSALIESTAMRW